MAGALRPRLIRAAACLPALVFVALPLGAALVLAVAQAASAPGWQALWADPQTLPALRHSLHTALAATGLSLAGALGLATALHGSPAWARLQRALAPMLALPHAAFAIGLALWWAPAGLLARLWAPLAGWQAPPPWHWVQEASGTTLVLTLAAKELPFLLWSITALLARPDTALTWQGQLACGQTLGHGRARLWWCLLWPTLARPLAGPVVAVLAYCLGVVDVALVTGPLAPPPLAVLAWQWLSDADPLRNAQGAAAALLLAGVLLALVGGGALLVRGLQVLARRVATSGRRGAARPAGWAMPLARALGAGLPALYGLVLLVLLWVSVAGPWSFPTLWPQGFTLQAWQQVLQALPLLGRSAGLALAAALAGAVLMLLWLEATPVAWDGPATPLLLAPAVLPPVLLLAGLADGALRLRLDGSLAGLWWVHTLYALPYMAVLLVPAWRGFDPRWRAVALTLRPSWWRYFLWVKLPLLRAPLAAALAVGFAVSVAQYLPTQWIGAGRLPTLTTEAVTLAAGGQRTLAAAFALLQALLGLAGFALALRWRAAAQR